MPRCAHKRDSVNLLQLIGASFPPTFPWGVSHGALPIVIEAWDLYSHYANGYYFLYFWKAVVGIQANHVDFCIPLSSSQLEAASQSSAHPPPPAGKDERKLQYLHWNGEPWALEPQGCLRTNISVQLLSSFFNKSCQKPSLCLKSNFICHFHFFLPPAVLLVI